MDIKILEKGIIGAVGACIMYKWGLLLPAIVLLIILMIVDFISGMLAAKKEALDHPNNKRYGWSSKKSIIVIYKKFSYILIILVAVSTDYIIYKFLNEIDINFEYKSLFSLLITIWLVINELLSILENSGVLGAKLPSILKKVLLRLRNNIDEES